MSYIHKALKKAQRDKDSRDQEYAGVLSGQKRKTNSLPLTAIIWICLAVFVSLLAFASYSWFDSSDQPPPVANNNELKKPIKAPVRKEPAVTPIKNDVNKKDISVTNAKELYDRAKAFQKSGRLINAKHLYQETLKVDPGYVDALNNLGVIYIHEKDYRAARDSFEKAIRLRPGYVDPHYNLACVYAITGEMATSLSHLKMACSLDPGAKKWAREDTDLKKLWGTPEFEEMIKN